MLTATVFIITPNWKQPKRPSTGEKIFSVRPYNGYHPARDVTRPPRPRKLLDISLSSICLALSPQARETSKNTQVRLHPTKKLLHSEKNHQQNRKATYQLREESCK